MKSETRRAKSGPPHRLKKAGVGSKAKAKNFNSGSQKTSQLKTGQFGSHKDGLLYGTHAVCAALTNPSRKLKTLYITAEAASRHQVVQNPAISTITHICDRAMLADMVPIGAVHQGMALDAEPLPPLQLSELDNTCGSKPIVILDQVSDPHNIGAILRSCAAFGAGAVVVQDRHSPGITGALAKAACGAVETIPICRVVNISRAIHALRESGRVCLACDIGGEELGDLLQKVCGAPLAMLLGAEGHGLRRLPKDSCDAVASIGMHAEMPSLNVSNVAAIALYAISQVQ